MTYTVYEIRNTETGRCYIGCTRNSLATRLAQHGSAAASKHPLHVEMREFGRNKFSITPLSHHEERLDATREEAIQMRVRGTLWPSGYNRPAFDHTPGPKVSVSGMTGNDLLSLRLSLGLSQVEMAAKLRVSRRGYQYAEAKGANDIGRMMTLIVNVSLPPNQARERAA